MDAKPILPCTTACTRLKDTNAFCTACKTLCKEIQGQLSLVDFDKLLLQVSKDNQIKLRQNRTEYRQKHNINHNEAVGWAADTEFVAGGNEAGAGGTGAVSITINNAADANIRNHNDLQSNGSDYEPVDNKVEEDLSVDESICKVSIGGYMSDSSSESDCMLVSPAPHNLVEDFCRLSVGNQIDPRDDIVIKNDSRTDCLVGFELTPMGPLDCHKVEVSKNGMYLFYLCKIPEYKLDVAAMLNIPPDERNIDYMKVATSFDTKRKRMVEESIDIDGTMWRKVHAIKLPFPVDKQLYDKFERRVDQFAVQRNGLGHTIGLVFLKKRIKSPLPRVAPTTGTMEFPESLRALFQMQGSPTAAAGGAVDNSVGGLAVSSNKHQQSASTLAAAGDAFGNSIGGITVNPSVSLAGTLGVASNLMGRFAFNSSNRLHSKSLLAESIPQSNQDASMVGQEQRQPQSSNVPTNVGDLERELAQVKCSLEAEREAAAERETRAKRLEKDFDLVSRRCEELVHELNNQRIQNTSHEQQLEDGEERANQAKSEVAKLKWELLELQKKYKEEEKAKKQAKLELDNSSKRWDNILDRKKKEIDDLVEQVKAQSSERKSNAESNDNNELLKSLLAKNRAWEADIEQKDSKISELESKCKSLEMHKDNLNTKYADALFQIKELKSSTDHAMEIMEDSNRLADHDQKINELTSRLNEKEEEAKSLQAELDKVRQDLLSRKMTLQEMESTISLAEHAKGDLENSNRKVNVLSSRLKRKEKEVQSLQAKLDKAHQDLSSKDSTRQEMEKEARSKLSVKDREIGEMNDQATLLKQKASLLEEQLKSIDKDYRQCQGDLHEAQMVIQSCKTRHLKTSDAI